MNSTEIVQCVAKAMDAIGVPYMLVGSFSANMYSIPRSTKDADFVVQFAQGQIAELREALGSAFIFDLQSRFETVTGTYKNIVHVVDSEFEIELFRLSSDPHDQLRFERRLRNDGLGFPVWIPTKEDVVITKLRWAVGAGRGKDRDDVRDLIAVQLGNARLELRASLDCRARNTDLLGRDHQIDPSRFAGGCSISDG